MNIVHFIKSIVGLPSQHESGLEPSQESKHVQDAIDNKIIYTDEDFERLCRAKIFADAVGDNDKRN